MKASHLCRGRTARGFTLTEFMVAMAITLVILAALTSIYVSSGQAFRSNDNFSRIQENTRIAFDLMSRDLRQTGYMGCNRDTSADRFKNVLNNSSNILWDFASPVYGYESSASSWNVTPDPIIASPSPISGVNHDILVVRSLDEGGGPIIANGSATDTLTVNGQSGITAGDILVTSECSITAVFQASSVTTTGGNNVILHDASSGSPGNASNNLATSYRDMELRRVSTKIYYIGMGANNIPALFVRRSNEAAAQELVEGIDGMSIRYGLDVNNNVSVDSYVSADSVTDWKQVISVEVTLWAISPENFVATSAQSNAAGTASDRRQRQQMTMKISLRNRTG